MPGIGEPCRVALDLAIGDVQANFMPANLDRFENLLVT